MTIVSGASPVPGVVPDASVQELEAFTLSPSHAAHGSAESRGAVRYTGCVEPKRPAIPAARPPLSRAGWPAPRYAGVATCRRSKTPNGPPAGTGWYGLERLALAMVVPPGPSSAAWRAG